MSDTEIGAIKTRSNTGLSNSITVTRRADGVVWVGVRRTSEGEAVLRLTPSMAKQLSDLLTKATAS